VQNLCRSHDFVTDCYQLSFNKLQVTNVQYCILITLQDEFADTFPNYLAFEILSGKLFPWHGKCTLQKNVLANLQCPVATWTISVSLLRSSRKLL